MEVMLTRILNTYDVLFTSQHAQLLSMYRQVRSRILDNSSKDELRILFKSVTTEVHRFFSSEEDMLSLILIEGVEDHVLEHKNLLAIIENYQSRYEAGNCLFIKPIDLIEIIESRVNAHYLEAMKIIENCHENISKFTFHIPDRKELDVKEFVLEDQHRYINYIVSVIKRREQNGIINQEVATLLFELIERVKKHFVDEEKMMEEFGFPQLERHKNSHVSMMEMIEKYKGFFRAGDLRLEMFEEINKVVIDHIKTEDKKYQEFFKIEQQ